LLLIFAVGKWQEQGRDGEGEIGDDDGRDSVGNQVQVRRDDQSLADPTLVLAIPDQPDAARIERAARSAPDSTVRKSQLVGAPGYCTSAPLSVG
jgi:hypothetical protein